MTLLKKKRREARGKKSIKKKLANGSKICVRVITEIGRLLLWVAILLMQRIKFLCQNLLHLFNYDTKRQYNDVSNCRLLVVVILPFFTMLMACKMLTITAFGLLYAVLVLIYKVFISEMDYAAYVIKFQTEDGQRSAPPANPQQSWRVLYFVVMIPLGLGLLVLHPMFPKEITWNVIYILGGFMAVVVGFLQDLINGLASIFEAQYPEYQYAKPVKYMEG